MSETVTLSIRHRTTYTYIPSAGGTVMRLRLYPFAFDSQKVEEWSVRVGDEDVSPNLKNAAGTEEGLWSSDGPIEMLDVVAEGVVTRASDNGIIRGLKERIPASVYLRDTPLTVADDAIRALANEASEADSLSSLHALSAAVRDAVDYEPGTTDMATSASAALEQRHGVCQDHAHVFIAAARSLGIPARYVAGYYRAGPGEAHTETHGRAEGYVEGLGWVGFDISNRTSPTTDHVRIACELDASRAALIAGAVKGHPEEKLAVEVTVEQAQQ